MMEQLILSIKIDMDDYLEVCKKCWEEGIHEISLNEYTYLSETQGMTNEDILQKYIPEEKDYSIYEFEVPADGVYFLVLRGCVQEKEMPLLNTCFLSLDGYQVRRLFLTLTFSHNISWVWPRLPQARQIIESKALSLKKGKHTLKIAPHKAIYLDAACVTDDPRIFVTR